MTARIACTVALLCLTGWLHGRWTDRWGAPATPGATVEQLAALPMTLGEWEGRDVPLREEVAFQLTASPTLTRQYANRASGTAVGFFLNYGRPQGLIMEHTPQICYASADYGEVGRGERVVVTAADGTTGEFLAHTFVKVTPAYTHRVRIFWAYGDQSSWSSPADPRLQFGGRPVLYKVYVSRDLVSEGEPVADDPTIPFLRVLLPELQRTIWPENGA